MLGVGVAESSGLLAAAIAINTDEEIERNSTAIERRGLRWAGYALFIFIAIVLGMLLPPEGVLRDPTQLTTDRYWEINCVDVALCDRFFVGLVGVVNGLVCVRSAFGRWGGDVFGVESSE